MPHRRIVDLLGCSWDVWDTRPGARSQVSPIYREGWLTFESMATQPEKRRLAPIPIDWTSQSDLELLALLGRATPVKGTHRTSLLDLEEGSAPPAPGA